MLEVYLKLCFSDFFNNRPMATIYSLMLNISLPKHPRRSSITFIADVGIAGMSALNKDRQVSLFSLLCAMFFLYETEAA